MQAKNNKIDLLNMDSYLRIGGRRKNDEFFRLLIDNMNEGVVIVDNDNSILYVNDKFCALIGSSSEDIFNQKITAYIDESSRVLWGNGLERCEKSKSHKQEIIWNNGHHEKIISTVSTRLLENKNSKNKIYFCIINDITFSKKNQEALEQSVQKYNNVVENALVGLYIEQNGKISYLNPHFSQILGYSRKELQDKETQGLLHPREDSVGEELKIHKKNGEAIWIKSNCTQIEYQGAPAMLGNIMDITQQKHLEESLLNSKIELETISNKLLVAQENERKRIAAELHDGIGQSLTAIKFKIEYLIQDSESNQNHDQAECLKKLIPMLKNATEETRRIAMALRPSILDDLSLKATVSWFCREYQLVYPSIKLEAHVDIDETELNDILKTTIYRVIQESFNNIAKHSKATAVLIHLTNKSNQLELYIEDNGIGFSLNEIDSKSSDYIGLGVSSMKQRVKQTGGALSINYGKNHKGTVICSTCKLS